MMQSIPAASRKKAQFFQAQRQGLDRHEIKVSERAQVARSKSALAAPLELVEAAAQSRLRHQERTGKGVGETFLLRDALVAAEEGDFRTIAVSEKVGVAMRQRHAPTILGVLAVDGKASPEFVRVREHLGNARWKIDIEDPEADVALNHLSQIEQRAITQT